MNNYTYTYACRNIFNTIKTSGHGFLEKYTSHFIRKFCVWEGVGDRTKTATYWPSNSSDWEMVLIPASFLQPIWTSCRQGYIIIWRPPTSCERHNFALNSIPRQSRPLLISWYLRPGAPVIYTGAFFWQLGRVGSQYATKESKNETQKRRGLITKRLTILSHKLDYRLFQNVQDTGEALKFIEGTMKNWSVELTAGGKVKLRCKSREVSSREMYYHHYYLQSEKMNLFQ